MEPTVSDASALFVKKNGVVPDGYLRCSKKNNAKQWQCPKLFLATRAGKSSRCDACRTGNNKSAQESRKLVVAERNSIRDLELAANPTHVNSKGEIPDGYQQCACKNGQGRRCKKLLIFSGSVYCDVCRKSENDRSLRWAKTSKGRQWKKEYRKSEAVRRYLCSEKSRARLKRYAEGEKCKKVIARYLCSAKSRARLRRYTRQPMFLLSSALRRMLNGKKSRSFSSLGIFAGGTEAKLHFQSTFLPWMTFANTGMHRKDQDYNVKWNIGHRIPKSWFDHNNRLEVKKAWSRSNLFAQCARANVEAGCRNLLSCSEWLALKSIWPKCCSAMNDDEAWIWASTNQALV